MGIAARRRCSAPVSYSPAGKFVHPRKCYRSAPLRSHWFFLQRPPPSLQGSQCPAAAQGRLLNVLTLRSRASKAKGLWAGLRTRGRQARLAEQFARAGYQVIGVAETRMRVRSQTNVGPYIAFHAPGTAMRTHGCSLWIQTKALAPFRRQFADPKQVAVTLLLPIRMFATIPTSAQHMRLYLVCTT